MSEQRPLRIAWLGHRSATTGDGIITYSRETTEGLRARGADVIFFHHSPELVDAQSYALDGIALAHRLVISPPRAKRMLIDLLQRHEVDVVHVSLSFSSLDFNLPRACHQLRIPIVATFHVPFDRRFSVWGGITNALYRVYAQALSECDRVIIFSEAQHEILVKLGVPGKVVTVLPNGVDVDKYSPGSSDKKEQFEAKRLFSYIGRLDPEKNVDVLLRAFLDAEPPAATKLVLVGGGSERKRLERRFRDPRIHFTGPITDEGERIAILRASDAFFLPSTVEGLSLAMLEAMACGVATVATDVGSDGDALRGAGIVLDPNDLGVELRAALKLLLDIPEMSAMLGAKARKRVLDRFSLGRNLDSLMALYQQLVETRSREPAPAPRARRGRRPVKAARS